MNEISRNAIETALNSAGTIEADVDTYSGRGMNGVECPAITVAPSDVNALFFALGLYAGQTGYTDTDWVAFVESARTDSMAYDTVVYFPRWTLTD